MLTQRIAQNALRRACLHHPTHALSRFAAPAAIATGNAVFYQRRLAATQTLADGEAAILAKQRRSRPVSPHLSIYKPQTTWILSIMNRITGAVLSGGFYVFGVAYLVAPALGWHLESASMAAAFATWPVVLKVITKMLIAAPFTFHSFNGLRHLMWDMGRGISNQQVVTTGWTVVGLTAVTTALLAFV